MTKLSSAVAAALELSVADRATLMRALRAADAGLDLDPASVRRSSDAELRSICGRAAPVDPLDFQITPRHLEILAEATARLTAMAHASA